MYHMKLWPNNRCRYCLESDETKTFYIIEYTHYLIKKERSDQYDANFKCVNEINRKIEMT